MPFDLEKEQLKLRLIETQISLLQYQHQDVQAGIAANQAAEAAKAEEAAKEEAALAEQRERNR